MENTSGPVSSFNGLPTECRVTNTINFMCFVKHLSAVMRSKASIHVEQVPYLHQILSTTLFLRTSYNSRSLKHLRVILASLKRPIRRKCRRILGVYTASRLHIRRPSASVDEIICLVLRLALAMTCHQLLDVVWLSNVVCDRCLLEQFLHGSANWKTLSGHHKRFESDL